jgi:hypothetical protein
MTGRVQEIEKRRTLMYIFHDESGIFAPSNKPKSYSVVTAFVLAESQYETAKTILNNFKERHGVLSHQEIKRRDLKGHDAPYFQLLEELADLDGILLAVGSDASVNSDIEAHRQTSCDFLLKLTERPGNAVRAALFRKMSDDIAQLSTQNYTELICRVRLVWEVMQRATGYFAQRRPEALAQMLWDYDYKDKKKTHFEQTLEDTALHLMERYAYEDPLQLIAGADYSKMDSSLVTRQSGSDESRTASDNRKWLRASTIFGSLTFVDSEGSEGVQIADLLANGLFGVLHNRFEDRNKAATLLGKLMVKREGKSVLPTLRFSNSDDATRPVEITRLMEIMADSARPVVSPRHARR